MHDGCETALLLAGLAPAQLARSRGQLLAAAGRHSLLLDLRERDVGSQRAVRAMCFIPAHPARCQLRPGRPPGRRRAQVRRSHVRRGVCTRGARARATGRRDWLGNGEQKEVDGKFRGVDVRIVRHVAVAGRVEENVKDQLHVARVHFEVLLDEQRPSGPEPAASEGS
eukprot:Tamp_23693.p1 GENE.Tamp_23693~~Tamp_23693.p1  ORF type:complete len:168 (+),score=15.02 Tamp_23693:325-828(+)